MEFKTFYGVTMPGVFFVASAFLRWQVVGQQVAAIEGQGTGSYVEAPAAYDEAGELEVLVGEGVSPTA